MPEEKTRVDFNAPTALVQRADAVADLLGISRTTLLITALRGELNNRVRDEAFQRSLKEAFYAGGVDFQTVEAVLGTEDALRMELLRQSIEREPPEPRLAEDGLPSQEEFYTDELREWAEEQESAEDEAETTAS